jgi:hypothetical protein
MWFLLLWRELQKSESNPQGKSFLAPTWLRIIVILAVLIVIYVIASQPQGG